MVFTALSVGIAALCNPLRVVRQIWPYITVLFSFAAFVQWNGGVVLGVSRFYYSIHGANTFRGQIQPCRDYSPGTDALYLAIFCLFLAPSSNSLRIFLFQHVFVLYSSKFKGDKDTADYIHAA